MIKKLPTLFSGPLPRRPFKSSVIMNELDQLRAEAEQLKNAIRVRLSGHNQDPDFLEKKLSCSLKFFSHERN